MKFTIHGFSQQRAIDLGLSNDDLLFLRWFSDWSNTGEMKQKVIKGCVCYWINYQTVCDELPILATKKDTLYRKLKKLCDAKVLKHNIIKVDGTYSYYGFGSAFLSLVSDTFDGGYGKKSVGGTEKNPYGVRKKIRTKDSSIKEINLLNNNNKKKTEKAKSKDVVVKESQIIESMQKFKELYKGDLDLVRVKELVKFKGIEHVNDCIDNYHKYIKGRKIDSLGADFNKLCKDGYTLPVAFEDKQKPQYANFEQREYDEEDYDEFCANLNM